MENRFGIFFKRAREQSGLTQKYFSDYFNYESPQFISSWECGASLPPIENLREIANLMNIPAEKLFEVYLESQVARATSIFKQQWNEVFQDFVQIYGGVPRRLNRENLMHFKKQLLHIQMQKKVTQRRLSSLNRRQSLMKQRLQELQKLSSTL